MKTSDQKISTTHVAKASPFLSKDNENFFGSTRKETPFFSKRNFAPVQTKLTVGRPNDKYEQEADAVADKVVQRLSENKPEVANKNGNAIQTKPIVPAASITPLVQPKCASCEQEEKLQKKEEVDEKDQLEGKLQKEPVFASDAVPPDDNKNIQRNCAGCEKEDEKKLQTRSENNSPQTAGASIESNLNASKEIGRASCRERV